MKTTEKRSDAKAKMQAKMVLLDLLPDVKPEYNYSSAKEYASENSWRYSEEEWENNEYYRDEMEKNFYNDRMKAVYFNSMLDSIIDMINKF